MKSHASFWEAAGVALDSLRGSKLRSFLTLLGIILSTTTLISVMAVINGLQGFIANSATTMGTEGFRVTRFAFVGNFDPKKLLEYQRKNPQLSQEEFQFLKEHVRLSREMGMSVQRGVTVTYEGDSVQGVAMFGNADNGAIMTNTEMDTGRYFTDTEVTHKIPVVAIGADIKNRFFPNVDPIGKTITADGLPLTVIGVGKPKGNVLGNSQDNLISIPIQLYFKVYGSRTGIDYNFIAIDKEHMAQAQEEVEVLLRSYRHLLPNQDNTFTMLSSDSLVGAFNQITGAIQAAALGIVSVFMVVGGVVIMNIMLAVVTERTREIGVRKSVGARRQDIMNQFLVESATLAGMGGLIGVGISWIAAVLVRNLAGFPMELPISGVVLGVVLSTVVGLFFGIYPARQASRLDPIVALRAES
ncbi:MAG: ABC transporter permease [Acidobacteriota bacterium]